MAFCRSKTRDARESFTGFNSSLRNSFSTLKKGEQNENIFECTVHHDVVV